MEKAYYCSNMLHIGVHLLLSCVSLSLVCILVVWLPVDPFVLEHELCINININSNININVSITCDCKQEIM